ncbi:PIN domain-containing protein [Lactococcus cremoris]|uniref:PIN domain-containing protein n=1 Tax=Lactococcus lactis subsp. cremoris TaxID=1359 RepID=UPI001C26D6FA|nr:PIN domain-containing protein [Lactococcus cremoris]MBU8904257.1 DUF4935 domain-containing protein [Lactococcus cremoris]MCT0487359.1 hypothetical protein [Lactococcus cremoris]MCT4454735.1 hypothetical protein [Lactococcus cremoris]
MKKTIIFIDTNVLLSLYDIGSDNLQKFEELLKLMENNIQVILPEQIKNEFYRNRENRLNQILTKLENFPTTYPNIIRDNSKFNEISKKINDVKKEYETLKKETKKAAADESLKADKVIKQIFEKTTWLKVNDTVIKNAKRRFDTGNPPGKKGSYGDAINWETLLTEVEQKNDLFFVSGDNDYSSQLDRDNINSYLKVEWKNKKSSNILYFRSLDKLLKDNTFSTAISNGNQNKEEITTLIADIDLENTFEQEKDELIQELQRSKNFAKTHTIINRLEKFSEWNLEQMEGLAEALINNSQVNYIISDDDVLNFYSKINFYDILFESPKTDIILAAENLITKTIEEEK